MPEQAPLGLANAIANAFGIKTIIFLIIILVLAIYAT